MKIFISTAGTDRQIAETLAVALRQERHVVFFDKTNLNAGDSYNERIRKEIDASDILVFLLSPESISLGSYTRSELTFAQRKWPSPKHRIVVVETRPVSWANVPPYLRSITHLKTEGNFVAEVSQQIAKLPSRRIRAAHWLIMLAALVLASFGWAWVSLLQERIMVGDSAFEKRLIRTKILDQQDLENIALGPVLKPVERPPKALTRTDLLAPEKLDYRGLTVLEDRRVLDLRGWVKSESLDVRSPATWIRQIRLVRNDPKTKKARFRFAASGGVYAECVSHSYHIDITGHAVNKPADSMMNRIDVVVEIGEENIGGDFIIDLRATMFNSFQKEPEEFMGIAGFQESPLELMSALILFPADRPCRDIRFEAFVSEYEENVEVPETLQWWRTPVGDKLFWRLSNPPSGISIDTYWVWGDD